MSGPETAPAPETRAIYPLFFTLGALSLVVQTYLVREFLVVVHGTEIVLGLLFASWLFWISCSAFVGVALASSTARPGAHLRMWIALGALTPVGQIELVRNGQHLLGVAPGLIVSWPQALLLAFVAMAPFCIMIGVTFPLGCRIVREQSSRGLGYLYMAEAAGALAGGLLCSLVLIGRTSAFAVIVVGAALLIASSALLGTGTSRKAGLVIAVLFVVACPIAARLDAHSRLRQLSAVWPGQEIVAVFDTPYEQVAIGRLDNQLTVYGDGLPRTTIPNPYETPAVIYRVVAQAPRARNILFVATPISGLALELVRVLGERQETSDAHVTFVYADQQLVTAVSGYLPVEETQAIRERVGLVVEDPRAYLKTQSEAYDLIFVDAPEPTAAHVNRFYTAEFYAIARRALSASGVLCFRLPSSADYVGREISELTVSVHKALSSVFDHVVTTPGEESYFFASAAAGQLTDDPAVIAARLRAYDGAAPFRDEIALDYEPTRLKRIGELMTAGRDAIANSDDHPSSYYYGAVLWERFSSEQPSANSWLARAHVAVQSVRTMHAVGGVLGLVGLWLIVRKRLSRKALAIDAAVAALVAGLSSMALNLVLLMAYQCACGALYQRIAIMTALLMLGVALSSGAVGRLAPRLRKPSAAVAVVLVAVALFAFMLPSGLQWLSGRTPFTQQVSFGLLFACTGALLGAGYPLTAQVLLAHRVGNPNAARAGGLVDALDHFGAALGALTVGTIILPAVGATSTLRWVALVAFVVGGVWLSRTDD